MAVAPAFAPAFNPFAAGFSEDPYPTYRYLREKTPVMSIKGCLGTDWVLSRYDDIRRVLLNPASVVDDLPSRIRRTAKAAGAAAGVEPLCRFLDHWLFFVNPPEHTRLRSAVAADFSKAAMDVLAARIQELTERFLAPRLEEGSIEIVRDVAARLPCAVAAAITGVPVTDTARLAQWSVDLFAVFVQPASLSHYERLSRHTEHFASYLSEKLSAADEETNLISRLAARCREGSLSPDEALAFCMMLFSVGQETTQHLIGNGLLALLEHPEQLEQVRERPETLPAAMKELARYNTPVQMIIRRAGPGLTLDGQTIGAGERLHLLLGSAHHDERVFDQPERLNIARGESSGLLFGTGPHTCLGSHLAMLTAGIALRTVLHRLRGLRLAGPRPIWVRSAHMRGMKSIECRFERAK